MDKVDPGKMLALDAGGLARAIDAAGRAILITDTSPSILYVNNHFTEVTGYEASEVIGKNPNVLQSGQQSQEFYQNFWESLIEHGSWEGEIWNRHKKGRIYPEWLTIRAVYDDEGLIQQYVSTFSDITSRKLTEDQLEDLAYFDPLTGLVNRRMFEDRLEQAVGIAKRGRKCCALLLIDLDGFKQINDTFGHGAGDRVLLTVAARIVGTMRGTDTTARLGGDEFIVLCPEIAAKADCGIVARRLVSAIREPIRLEADNFVNVDASIGISAFPDDASDPNALIQAADTAMYSMKASGKGGFCFAADDIV